MVNDYIESILDYVKQMFGIGLDDTSFDKELVGHTNGALMVMTQLGVGPDEGYRITSKEQTWADFLGDRTDLELVKTDVYLRVKLVFDPPTNSFLVNAINDQIKEYDFRIECWHKPGTHIEVDPVPDDYIDD